MTLRDSKGRRKKERSRIEQPEHLQTFHLFIRAPLVNTLALLIHRGIICAIQDAMLFVDLTLLPLPEFELLHCTFPGLHRHFYSNVV